MALVGIVCPDGFPRFRIVAAVYYVPSPSHTQAAKRANGGCSHIVFKLTGLQAISSSDCGIGEAKILIFPFSNHCRYQATTKPTAFLRSCTRRKTLPIRRPSAIVPRFFAKRLASCGMNKVSRQRRCPQGSLLELRDHVLLVIFTGCRPHDEAGRTPASGQSYRPGSCPPHGIGFSLVA